MCVTLKHDFKCHRKFMWHRKNGRGTLLAKWLVQSLCSLALAKKYKQMADGSD